MNKVLLIEDDEHLATEVALLIEGLGLALDRASDGMRGLEMAGASDYCLILLDIMLPRLDGVEVCKRIREHDKATSIIMLTAKADELNKVLLLELGADDYITKPFSGFELKARIKAVLRRSTRSSTATAKQDYVYDTLRLDFDKREAILGDVLLSLTASEFDILEVLATRPGFPFTRDQLLNHLYGGPVVGYTQSISSHVNRIRTKIELDPSVPRILKTVRGTGYALADPTTAQTHHSGTDTK